MRKFTLLLLLVIGFHDAASAQWRLIFRSDPWNSDGRHLSATAPSGKVVPRATSYITALHFLSREGAPNTGFVAVVDPDPRNRFTCTIWRTTDAGTTWTSAYSDSLTSISCFSFEDSLVGYATYLTGSSTHRYLKTTDGGQSWSTRTLPGGSGWSVLSRVYYHIPKGRLFLGFFDTLLLSTDHGSTWKIQYQDIQMGAPSWIAFANDSVGIAMSQYQATPFRTVDGGLNWTLASVWGEFQPVGIPPNKFLTATSAAVFRSTTGGATWTTGVTIPGVRDLTGNIAGSGHKLYVVGPQGTASSTDTGVTWRKICGPTDYNSSQSVTVPHFVHGDTIYMKDFFYGLWMNPTGQDSDVRYPLLGGGTWSGATCKPTTMYFGLYNGNSCSTVQVTGFSMWGSNRFRLLSDTTRHHQIMGLSDTLKFLYDPFGVGVDSFFVRVSYNVGTDHHIDTFYMVANRNRPFTYTAYGIMKDTLESSCDSSTGYVTLSNYSCDTLLFTKLRLDFNKFTLDDTTSRRLRPDSTFRIRIVGRGLLPGAYYDTLRGRVFRDSEYRDFSNVLRFVIRPVPTVIDSLHWSGVATCLPTDTALHLTNRFCDSLTVTGIDVDNRNVFAFPDTGAITVGPGATRTFRITTRTDSVGYFTSQVTFHLYRDGVSWDTTLAVTLNATTPKAFTLAVPSTTTFTDSCSLLPLRLNVVNVRCDTLVLDSVLVSGPARLDTTLQLPAKIVTNRTLRLPFAETEFHKGSYTVTVHCWMHSHGTGYDTSISILYVVKSEVRPGLARFSNKCSLPSSTLCGSFDTVIRFANRTCRDMLWTAVDWSVPLADYSFTASPLPRWLAPGMADSVHVHYAPTAAGIRSAQMHLSFRIDNEVLDTDVVIAAQVITAGLLAPQTASLDTIEGCGAVERGTWILNVACDSVQITDIHATDGSITIVSPEVGTWVHSKDTVHIQFLVSPSGNGSYASRIYVSDSSANGVESIPIYLSGWVTAPHRSFAAIPNALNVSDAPACVDFDTSITIVNTSDCDTLAFDAAQLLSQSSSLSILQPTTREVLGPHDTLTVVLRCHLDPLQSVVNTCHIVGDTTFDIPITMTAGGAESALSVTDHQFRARICTSQTKRLMLRDIGCADITIDSIALRQDALSPSSFRVTRTHSLPFVLHAGESDSIECTFDAEANEQVRAVIYIHSTASNAVDSIVLTGTGYGQRSTLSLASLINGGRVAVALPADIVTFTAHLANDLPAGEGLQQIQFNVNYGGGLLTPLRTVTTAGWSASMNSYSGGISIVAVPQDPNQAQTAGTDIARVEMRVTMSDDSVTPVVLSGTTFNSGDTTYGRCVLGVGVDRDSTEFRIAPFCGEALYLGAMRGQPIGDLTVTPKDHGIAVIVRFNSNQSDGATVTVQAFDVLGHAIAERTVHAQNGSNETELTLPHSGAYVVRATATGESVSKRVVLLR